MKRTGIPFEVYAAEVDETCFLPAEKAVCEISLRKAREAARVFPGSYILSADTLVSVDGFTLGKPRDSGHAEEMLCMLSGRQHQVSTGVTVITPSGRAFTDFDRTDVFFSEIPLEEIRTYVASGEPMDKAGGYGLQGRAGLWVRRIEGCDSSVIGLPLYLVRSLLIESGFPFLPYFGTQSDY